MAASNLRAENYDIPPTDRHKVGCLAIKCSPVIVLFAHAISKEIFQAVRFCAVFSLVLLMCVAAASKKNNVFHDSSDIHCVAEQVDSWQDHSCHRYYYGCSGGSGVPGADQDCPGTQKAGVI